MILNSTTYSLENIVYLILVIIIIIIISFYLIRQLRKDIRESKKIQNEVDKSTHPIIYPIRRNILNYSFVLSDEEGKVLFYSKCYRSFVGMNERIKKFVCDIEDIHYEISDNFDRKVALFYSADGEYLGMSTFEKDLSYAISFVLNCSSYKIVEELTKRDDFLDIDLKTKKVKFDIIETEHGFAGVHLVNHEVIFKTTDREDKKKIKEQIDLLEESIIDKKFYCIKRRNGYQLLFEYNDEIIGFSKVVEQKEDLDKLFE